MLERTFKWISLSNDTQNGWQPYLWIPSKSLSLFWNINWSVWAFFHFEFDRCKCVILLFSNYFHDGFLPIKYCHAQDVEIGRRNVEWHDLTFGVQLVMLRVTRRRRRAFVWKSKQNQCHNELLNAYKLAMTRTMDCNNTDKYQVSLCLYLET